METLKVLSVLKPILKEALYQNISKKSKKSPEYFYLVIFFQKVCSLTRKFGPWNTYIKVQHIS